MAKLRDVAERAGVSVPTVSLVLSGRGDDVRYSSETQERVYRAAAELGYRPNIAARGLQQQKSFLIGVFFSGVNSTHTSEFLRGVMAALRGEDYSPLVFTSNDIQEEQEYLNRAMERRVDGLIVNPNSSADGSTNTELINHLAGEQMPVIEVFGHFMPGVPSANLDDRQTGRTATEHLLAQGHRRIAMLSHEQYASARTSGGGCHWDAWERYKGYEEAVHGAGCEPIVFSHPIAPETADEDFFRGGLNALPELLAHPDHPTAVVCYNDQQAYGLLRACRLENISVPGELSVVGYSDMGLSSICSPPLTTLQIPSWEVGRTATQMLIARLEGHDVEGTVVESELIVRESTASPERRAIT